MLGVDHLLGHVAGHRSNDLADRIGALKDHAANMIAVRCHGREANRDAEHAESDRMCRFLDRLEALIVRLLILDEAGLAH